MQDEDAKDLPIELRTLDDYEYSNSGVGFKSRSLGSILGGHLPQKQIVRSLSSVPNLDGSNSLENNHGCSLSQTSKDKDSIKKRPKLMKQKQSITDGDNIYRPHGSCCNDMKSQLLRKQSSLNEELMAESRIREKERIRKRIQKQVSLNETFLYRSLLTKRLQVIREGVTAKFKKSTGSIERLTKNGFVKIIKNIKTVNLSPTNSVDSDHTIFSKNESKEPIISSSTTAKIHFKESNNGKKKTIKYKESFYVMRKTSESDSSKEGSLQSSDTSVESEDSFASVIHNPTCLPTSPLALSMQSPNVKSFQKDSFTFEIVDKKNMIDEEKLIVEEKKPKTFLRNDLPEIPKFNKSKLANFPIVKRLNPSSSNGKNIIVPRLKSLEIFNPEIDDSDSCDDEDNEENDDDSTPDSIDSVININEKNVAFYELASRSRKIESYFNADLSDSSSSPPITAKIKSQKKVLSNLSKRQQQSYHYQTQNQKMNDFILEENENENTEDEQVNNINHWGSFVSKKIVF